VGSGEFMQVRKESEKVKGEIEKEVGVVSGGFKEELVACKEVISKMVKKYKNKKEEFNFSVELRGARETELLQGKDRLMILRDRLQITEGELNIMEVSEDHEDADTIMRFSDECKKMKKEQAKFEKALEAYGEKL